MKKTFNTTGLCYPHLHYMVDVSEKLRQVLKMVNQEAYFTINRPRQYGKTTILYLLEQALQEQGNYLPIKLNFQGIDDVWHTSDGAFAQMFCQQISRYFKFTHIEYAAFFKEKTAQTTEMNALSDIITEFIYFSKKDVVLIIDEVDASSNFNPFLKFLAMLRTKYLTRHEAANRTFKSVVLAGVHDVKSLKSKIRSTDNNNYNSPWNIATDFKIKLSFSATEIATMLREYCATEGTKMDIEDIAQNIFYHTSGYPFLVSKICEIVVEEVLHHSNELNWKKEHIQRAIQYLLKQTNTNFESIVKNLEQHTDLYHLVKRLLIEGDQISFNQLDPIVHKGILYGIFSRTESLQIHNRIYEQLIYNYLTSKEVTSIKSRYIYNENYFLEGSQLNIANVLRKFQAFMKEQYSERNDAFLEEHGRLIFLSFFSPILNGKGHAFREVQSSMEKRLDVVVTYLQHKYVIELKRWYGPKAHAQGLDQLVDYLDLQGLDKGYLLIYDFRKNKKWREEWIEHRGKKIFAIWV